MLKRKLDQAAYDALEAAVKPLYIAKDGGFVLDAEEQDIGALERAKQHEATQRAEALKRVKILETELAALKERQANPSTPDPVTSDSELQKQLQAHKKASDDRIAAIEKSLAEEKTARASAEKKLNDEKILNALRKAATEAGAADEAIDDVINRTRSPWTVDENGNLVAKDGDTVLFSKEDPGRPMSPVEHAKEVLKTAKHLLKPSSGAGAQGGAGPTVTGNVIHLNRAQAADVQTYRAARERAAKEGKELQVAEA